MFIHMTVSWEKSVEEYYASNLAQYYLTLYGHKLSTAMQHAADEPEESDSVGDFFASQAMQQSGIVSPVIKPS